MDILLSVKNRDQFTKLFDFEEIRKRKFHNNEYGNVCIATNMIDRIEYVIRIQSADDMDKKALLEE